MDNGEGEGERGNLYTQCEGLLKGSYSSQKKFLDKLFKDLLTLSDQDINTLFCILLESISNLEFPFAILLGNDCYLEILGDLFFEQNFNAVIWKIINECVNKIIFINRAISGSPLFVISPIQNMIKFAENLGSNNILISNNKTDASQLESLYLEYLSLITDCECLKSLIEENPNEEMEDNNINQISFRINKMMNNELKIYVSNYPIYIYDFLQELSRVLSEYEEFFSKKSKGYLQLQVNNNINNNNITKKDNTNNYSENNSLDPKDRSSFYYNEFIHIDEGMSIEYKNYHWPLSSYLIEVLKNQICAFLNSMGGRIYLGITDEKIVKGVNLKPKKRDLLRNEIANYTKDFYPHCRVNKIEVVFVPVKDKKIENNIPNIWVVKIIIKQGDVDKLYSNTNKGFSAYMRMPGQCILLSAMETSEEIIKRKTNPKVAVEDKEFYDIAPEFTNEEHTKSNNSKIMFDSIFNSFQKNSLNRKRNGNSSIPTSNTAAEEYNYTLHVQNIPTTVGKNSVMNIFQTTNFTSERIFLNKTKMCLGWAFFNYANKKDADDAVNKTKGAMINGVKIYVKLKEK